MIRFGSLSGNHRDRDVSGPRSRQSRIRITPVARGVRGGPCRAGGHGRHRRALGRHAVGDRADRAVRRAVPRHRESRFRVRQDEHPPRTHAPHKDGHVTRSSPGPALKNYRRMRPAHRVAQAGVIAAAYAALTYLLLQLPGGIAWGFVQLRLSEALTVVACITPAAIPGLALGSALANLSSVASLGAAGWLDVVFGSLGTLLGAAWSWRFRERTALALAG